jgi:predicted Ser/Thr protein kinase
MSGGGRAFPDVETVEGRPMNEAERSHPTPAQLAAFDLGHLAPDDWALVERHVADCAACCAALEALPDDTLVTLVRGVGRLPDPVVADTVDWTASGDTPAPAAPATDIPAALADHPRYRVLELLGVGGMGTVFKAEHRLMRRTVALKVVNKHLTQRAAAVERFRLEVQAAAQLSHPNVVTAHDAEQAGDVHFLVMEYVEGTNLDRLVQQRGPLPVREACDYVLQATLGLQYANERGLIHRDLKPANLLLTPSGQVKILDFGLARLAREAAPPGAVTPTGTLIGTPDYVAPEQALEPHKADVRADLYSLGCTLYFLLAGQPPFPDGSVLQKLMAHQGRSPRPLRELRPDVPAPLLRVVDRLLAKDPARRYATPADLAAALEPFTRPTDAAPARRLRWPRYALAALPVLLAACLAGGLAWHLLAPPPGTGGDGGRPPVKLAPGELRRLGDGVPFNRVTFSADCRRALVALNDPDRRDFAVRVWDLEAGKELRRLEGHEDVVMAMAFSPDGTRVLTGGRDSLVRLWDAGDGRLMRTFEGHTKPRWVRGVCFLPDGKRALSTGNDERLLLWDLATGQLVKEMTGHEQAVSGVAVVPGGGSAVTGSWDATVRVWDLATGAESRRLGGHADAVSPPVVSADGRLVLAGGQDSTVRLWRLDSGREVCRCTGHDGAVTCAALAPDGQRALSGGGDGTVRLWDLGTGEDAGAGAEPRPATELRRFDWHPGGVLAVAFGPDGRVWSGGRDGTLREWQLAAGTR